MDPQQIDVEMRRAQAEFHQLITGASPDDLQAFPSRRSSRRLWP
jgi:hypothetical protein